MTEGHFDSRKAPLLDSEGRIKDLRPDELLRDVAGLGEGMTCVDLGCGTGIFSFPMSRFVGDKGVIYAVDDSARMLEYMRAKQPPPNLVMMQRDAGQTGLDNQIADFCLLAFILHEVKQPQRLVSEAFRLLKPGGKVMAVEWKAELDKPGPPRKIRLTRAHIEQLFQRAGFSGLEYLNWSANHYVATSVKE